MIGSIERLEAAAEDRRPVAAQPVRLGWHALIGAWSLVRIRIQQSVVQAFSLCEHAG
ncbi:MAG: hypothetical protein KJZ69_08885 [Phycisphaerales bacterium]|nr:hypothetical protein [Phycisphaerales bacterium]